MVLLSLSDVVAPHSRPAPIGRWNTRSSIPMLLPVVVVVVDAANHAKIDDGIAIEIYDDHAVDHLSYLFILPDRC